MASKIWILTKNHHETLFNNKNNRMKTKNKKKLTKRACKEHAPYQQAY